LNASIGLMIHITSGVLDADVLGWNKTIISNSNNKIIIGNKNQSHIKNNLSCNNKIVSISKCQQQHYVCIMALQFLDYTAIMKVRLQMRI